MRGTQAGSMVHTIITGEAGLVKVKYKGFFAREYYKGDFTAVRYPFGLERMVGYVDKRDLPGLLELQEDGQVIFEVVK